METQRNLIDQVAQELSRTMELPAHTPGLKDAILPDREEVRRLLRDLQTVLFPRFFPQLRTDSQRELLRRVHRRLMEQVALALPFGPPFGCDASCVGERLIAKLPEIRQALIKDAEAIYLGDPAARTREVVMLCYPGFYAMLIQRLAHELYLLRVPLLPRMMTEYAHEKTGIDIHAGASIGEYFCIDHGSGIVIGETAVIGNHVKLYQGVTLGARSFALDQHGHPVKGHKRHPEIRDHVVIYANATILGGDTVIGDHCVIGGNVWITQSVPAGTTVYFNGAETVNKEQG